MRTRQVGLLVGFYLTFIRRRVLRRGVLASPAARVGATALGLITLALLTGIAFFVLKDMAADPKVLALLLNLSSLSAVLWVLVAFIFTKVLFLKSERMLSLSYHLPVTGKERAVAVILFEALLVGSVIAVLFTSSMVPIIVLHGLRALAPIAWAIVCPVIVTYLLLNASYLAAQRLLGRFGLERSRSVILLTVVALLTALYYGRIVTDTLAVANAYAEGHTLWTVPTAFTYLAERAGWPVSLAAFLILLALLLWASVGLAPHTYVPSQRHAPLPLGRLVRLPGIGPQLAMHVRNSEWLLAAALGLIVGSVFLASDLAPPVLACGLVVFQGLGAYANSSRLSWLQPRGQQSPVRAYARLIGAQLAALTPLLAILTASALIVGRDPATQATAALGVLAGVFLVTLVGILFPPDHDNPFSAAVGIAVVGSVGLAGLLAVNMFSLSPLVLTACGAGLLLLGIVLSIAGMSINDRRSRHEEANQHPARRSYLAATHTGDRRGGNPVCNVQYDG